MNWYLTKIIYQILCGDGKHIPQFDEQLRLVHAEDELHAFTKARLLGEREQDCFLNIVQKPVRWMFIDVCEIYLIDQLTDGAEVYSRIREDDDAAQYINVIKKRAAHILEHCKSDIFLNQ